MIDMAKTKKLRAKHAYGAITVLAKPAAPLFKLLYYTSILLILLSGIVALIILLVNLPVEEMLLPPFMSANGKESYSIYIGSGIRVDAAYALVMPADIKTVIYAQLLMTAAFCCMLAPVSLFLSKLLANIASGAYYHLKNARYMLYIALSSAIGITVLQTAGRFYNYLLVKTFVTEPDIIRLSLGFDADGLLVGLLIALLAGIYGRACEAHLAETASAQTQTQTQTDIAPTEL